jgi:hypothetical protein
MQIGVQAAAAIGIEDSAIPIVFLTERTISMAGAILPSTLSSFAVLFKLH